MPFTILTEGTFTSTGVGVIIPVPQSANYFKTVNITQLPLTPATPVVITSEWYGPNIFNDNDGIRWKKSANTSVINIDTFATATASNGFTYVTQVPKTEAALTGTTITQADGAVFSVTNTYSNGDRVRIYNSTGMLQIAGMDFTIQNVSGSAFTAFGLDSSGFAAAGTAFQVRRISKLGAVEPRALFITKISLATQAVVTLSCDATLDYVVGDKVYFSIASGMGMPEMNGLTGTIVAMGTFTTVDTFTITVDINSSNFTAFAFPASTAVPTSGEFSMISMGGQKVVYNPLTNTQYGWEFNLSPFHTGQFVPFMMLSGGAQSPAGANGDVIVWQALQAETGLISALNPGI